VWNRTLAFDLMSDRVGVVGSVGHDQAVRWQVLEQGFGGPAVCRLSGRHQERLGTDGPVGQRVELGGAAAAADAERLVMLPSFLPPAAHRCARICVLSSSNSAGGPPAVASALNRSAQIPFAAQRTNRL